MTLTDRPPLSRRRIADAALGLIDSQGLRALSMRKLGAEVGVEAMSLYNYVDNKADLLDAVADHLFGKVLVAYGNPVGDWKVHARALCHAYVDVAAAHPRAVSLLISPAHDSPAAREFDARIVEAARLMTPDVRIGALAFAAVSNWVIGTIVQQHGLMRETGRESEPPSDERVAHFQHAAHTITVEERFEEGLETVLAGLEARYFDT